jgi:hypothetical protein
MAKTTSKQSPRKPSNNVISLASHREKHGKALSLDELVRIEHANREQQPRPKEANLESVQYVAQLIANKATNGEVYGVATILFDQEAKACRFVIGGNIHGMPATLYSEVTRCVSSLARQRGLTV